MSNSFIVPIILCGGSGTRRNAFLPAAAARNSGRGLCGGCHGTVLGLLAKRANAPGTNRPAGTCLAFAPHASHFVVQGAVIVSAALSQ